MAKSPAKGASHLVVFDGQSLNLEPSAGTPYPRVLMASHPTVAYRVAAITAMSWTTLSRTRPVRTDNLAKSAATAILVMCGGTTDVHGENDTGATIFADMTAYADAAKAAGFDYVVACTINKSTAMNGTEDGHRTDANTLILANSGAHFDYMVDLAGNSNLSDPTNSTYYSDGTHWTQAGANVAAGLVGAVLTPLLP